MQSSMNFLHSPISIASNKLSSEDCDSVFISPKNETVSQNSILGHNYMFYWLHGTSFVSVFLLNDRRSFDLWMNCITSEKFLKKWVFNISNCGIVRDTGLMRCCFEYTVLNSGYYYICVNSTIFYKLQFNISISSLVYNTSRSTTALQCIENQECCLPFGNIVKELHRPTCIFVSTLLVLGYQGISLHVEQQFSIFWYSSYGDIFGTDCCILPNSTVEPIYTSKEKIFIQNYCS